MWPKSRQRWLGFLSVWFPANPVSPCRVCMCVLYVLFERVICVTASTCPRVHVEVREHLLPCWSQGPPCFCVGATFCGPELLCRSVPLSLPPILPQEHWDHRGTHAHTHIRLLGLSSVIWTQVARYTWQAPLSTKPFPETYFYVIFYELLLIWNTIHEETINVNGLPHGMPGRLAPFSWSKILPPLALFFFFLCGWNQKPGVGTFWGPYGQNVP